MPAGLDLVGAGGQLAAALYGAPATVAGYSMGGRVALHLALGWPGLVERLVLVSATAGMRDAAERAERRRADEELAGRIEAGGEAGLGGFVTEWLSGPLFAGLSERAAGREARLSNTASGLAGALRALGTGSQEPLWDRLAGLEMPVLVIAGERDGKFVALGHEMVAAIGENASILTMPGAGHAACFEDPERFVEIVARFAGGAKAAGGGAERAGSGAERARDAGGAFAEGTGS